MSQERRSDGMKWIFALIFSVIIILFAFDSFDDGFFDIDSEISEDTEVDKSIYDSEVINKYEFYYDQLNTNEKKLYDAMRASVAKGKTSCKVRNYDQSDIKSSVYKVLEAFEHDHPEFFWINGGAKYSWLPKGDGKCDLELTLTCYQYWNHSFDQEKYLKELNREVNYVSALANEYQSDYEKVLFVHDYLARTAEYDFKGLEEAKKTVHDAGSEFIYSAYGCLINKDTVCAGYAKAMQLVLNNIGIECIYVTGYAGERHAWNMIRMDGENYYVDLTWNDTSPVDKKGNPLYPDEAVYTYFGITTKELEITHTIEKDIFDIPSCEATKYNYYLFNDYYIDNYDAKKMESVIKDQQGRNMISMRFSTGSVLNTAVGKISQFINVPSPMRITSYSSDEEMMVLTLYAK